MPDVISVWDDFSGGHWGNLGPTKAQPNQWGGLNMTLTKSGGLVPVCASRWMPLNASVNGKVWGMYWAWGADGRLYFVQQAGSSTTQSRVYRFSPTTPTTTSVVVNVLSTTSTFAYVPTTEPDWVGVGNSVYMTVYGNKTYTIDTSGNTMIKLTGSYGDAPAGRAICLYGERLMVGGISDSRFGTQPNRIVFSGDDTGNDPTIRTAWESLNYFDLGADNDTIVGLYNMRDFLVVVMADEQIWIVTGTPNANISARRVYGFHKGAGSITAFLPSHGAVDPSQTKLWMFDHATRAPIRFNGANITKIQTVGIPHADREGDDLVEGQVAMIGGPDEFVMHGVAASRMASTYVTTTSKLELIRLNGTVTLMQNDNIASRQ